MSFINTKIVEASAPLKKAHFPFNRGEDLFEAMSWCVTDYYTKALVRDPFEARGLMVIRESRQGKSKEIERLLKKFKNGSVVMPDGRQGTIIHVLLSSKVTWKDLGLEVLKELGYKLKGRRTKSDIWGLVTKYAKLQGVVGIHFDECQHVFSETGNLTNQQFLDTFKSLLKDTRWPLMQILSGIPSLAAQVAKEQQFAYLLRTVRFEEIDMSRQADKDEMMEILEKTR